MKGDRKSKGKSGKGGKRRSGGPQRGRGTGRARTSKASAPSAPHPAAVGGIAAGVIGLLITALVIATGERGSTQEATPPPPPPTAAAPAEPAAPSQSPPAVPVEPPPAEPANSAPAPVEAPGSAPARPAGSVFDQASARIEGPTETVRVDRVIDGDTLELSDGRKVRLVGINTPERDRPLYEEATAVLRELVEGQQVTLEFDEQPKDQYKRLLAYVHKDGVFVNGEIVRQGMAYTFVWPKNRAHMEDLRELQVEARMKGVGLWALPQPDPAPLYIGNRRAPYFHREGCHRIKRLSGRNRVEFTDRDEALDAGMNPCADCGS